MDIAYVHEYAKLETFHWWFVIRKKIIAQALRKCLPTENTEVPLKILNIGAAGGASSKWLSAFGEVDSVEYDLIFLEYLESQNIPVTYASVTALPFMNDYYDLVCAFDIIEHVEDHGQAVKEIIRVCKPSGNICITVPAFQSLWGNHDVVNGHKRRYTKSKLKQLIDKQGPVKYLYTTYFNSILFFPVFLFRKISKLFRKTNKATSSDFSFFTTNIYVNGLLKIIFGIEPFLLKWFRFPVGVSILMLTKKEPAAKNESH